MKIKEIKLNKFKRFTDLLITDIPETAKLVILVGPNGCGKTSVFEGLNHWYKYNGFRSRGDKDYYVKEADKDIVNSDNWYNNRVSISIHDGSLTNQNEIHGSFYFRTAHRNEPDFTTNNLSKQDNPKERIKYNTLMDTDCTVSENYQRLVSNTLSGVFNHQNDNKSVKDLREELIGRIKKSLNNVFDDLQLISIGDPLVNGSFYFTKGNSANFHYKNLSAGEKSAFDLLLDIVIKSAYFNNTVYCIDEPETHMHTALQSKLLNEMYNLVYDLLSKAGIKRYEVSNFAMLDYESKHNQNYWKLGEYLAFGIGGHSYMNDTRFANTDDFDKYIKSIEENTFPIVMVEKLSLTMRREEAIMLELRTREGLNIEEFDDKFGGHILRDKKKEIEFLSSKGFISLRNGYIKVSENAYYVLNSIIMKLI